MSNQIVITSGAKLRDLDDVIVATDGILSSVAFNVANGVPRLDENGKILVSQLPNSVMEFKGVWNAATNTPTLVNGTGNAGDVWLCNVAGTVDFGAGPIAFAVGDYAVYTGTVWARSSGATGTVTSVGVSRDGNALAITGSPVTSAGTINLGFSGDNTQYINGAGNLTTFPSLTGFVPYTGATQDVDLGIYDLTSRLIKIDGSSSGGSLNIKQNATTILSGIGYNSISAKSDTSLQVYYGNATTSTFRSILLNVNNLIDGSTRAFEFPDANGTLALTSDISYPVTSVFGRTGAVVATSGDYNTDQVTEGITNLYFTNARARTAISLTTTGTSGPATYNNTTGVFNIPNYTTDLTGYVPYTGATTNVNLGVHSLSAYDLIINHTSGSGVAASITKGGSGEALTVVKSSGSGNAASITGGVTLLSELNLTTDLADAYIASAANWNTAYTNRITSLTTTGTSGPATLISNVLNIPNYADQYVGTVTSVGLSAPTGFSVSGSPVTTSGTLALSFASGYSLPTNVKQSNWDDAYTWVAAFPTQTGNTGKFLTTDGSSLSWAANPLGTVTSVDMSVPTGLTVSGNPITTSGTLAVTLTAGYVIPTQSTLDGKIPYSGAISNVNLGAYGLQAGNRIITGRTTSDAGGSFVMNIGNGTNYVGDANSTTIYSDSAGRLMLTYKNATQTKIVGLSASIDNTQTYLQWPSSDGTIALTSQIPSLTGYVTGTGTTNTLSKFTGSSTIGDSLFTDNGTNASFGGANYSSGTGVRTFNITAPSFAGVAFWTGTSQYTADIFSYQGTGNLLLNADPSNTLSASNILLNVDDINIAIFNTTNVTLTRALSGTSASFSSTISATQGTFTSNNGVIINSTDASYVTFLRSGTTYGYIGTAGTASDIISGAATGDLTIRAQQKMLFATGGDTARMTLDASGNLGLGVTPTVTAGITEFAIGTSTSNPRISGIRDGVSAFAFSSDSGGTSLFERRNLELRLGTNNSTKMFITNGGNVGIGITPSAWRTTDKVLQINNSALYDENGTNLWLGLNFYENSSGIYIFNNNGYATSYRQDSGTHKFFISNNGLAGGNVTWTTAFQITAGGTGSFLYDVKALNYAIMSDGFRGGLYTYKGVSGAGTDYGITLFAEGGTGNGNIYFCPNGSVTKFMTITTSNTLLVNTASGVTGGGTLQVNGNVNINGVFQINGVTIGGGGGGGVTGAGTLGYHSRWTSSTSLGNSVIYDDGTNVGINTTSVPGLLTLRAAVSNTPSLVFQNVLGGPNSAISNYVSAAQTYTVIGTNAYVNNTANIARFSSSYAGCYIAFDEGTMVFGTGTSSENPSGKMSISPTGTVNFNVTTRSPNYGITRVSLFRGGLYTYDAVTGSGSDYGLTLFAEGGSGGGNIYFCPGGSYRAMTVNTSNNVLIGTSTDNGYRLQVSGDLYVSGSSIYVGGVSYSGVQTFNNLVYLNSTTYVASGQGITWKGSSGTTYDFSISNSGTVPYILSGVEIDLNAPLGMRYGLIYTFKGNGSAAYNVNILNSGKNADELQFLGGLLLNTTSCGFVPPKMTTTQRNALNATVKVAGCIIYNTTLNTLQCYNGSAWADLF